jgi:hypothetical protein
MPNSLDSSMQPHDGTLRIVFDSNVQADRIAKFIELLSDIYGEDLNIVATTTLPPDQDEYRKAA